MRKGFVVVVTCQGQPFYYYHKSLLSAFINYARRYYLAKKYGTMNVALKEVFK